MRKLLALLIIFFISLGHLVFAEKDHKDWNTYTDKRFGFSVQYPKNWEIEFWKDKTEPDPYFGRLADYSKKLVIEFAVYKLNKEQSLKNFVEHTVNKNDKFYFKETKNLYGISMMRYGVHLFLEDGESYLLRQFIKIDQVNIIDLMADLPKNSMEKKDDKYQLVVEIMDTFKKL